MVNVKNKIQDSAILDRILMLKKNNLMLGVYAFSAILVILMALPFYVSFVFSLTGYFFTIVVLVSRYMFHRKWFGEYKLSHETEIDFSNLKKMNIQFFKISVYRSLALFVLVCSCLLFLSSANSINARIEMIYISFVISLIMFSTHKPIEKNNLIVKKS